MKMKSCLKKIKLKAGPFKSFLVSLQKIQSTFPEENNPIRTALVTARSAPAHKRVIHTMREWGIRIDESFFLGGLEKGVFLREFGADIFFDDQQQHCGLSISVCFLLVMSQVELKIYSILNRT